jgi:hypothetical protein
MLGLSSRVSAWFSRASVLLHWKPVYEDGIKLVETGAEFLTEAVPEAIEGTT